MQKTKQFFLNRKEGRKATYKIYLGVIFSLTFLLLFSLVSSLDTSSSNPLGYYNPNLPNINQKDISVGSVNNSYYNNTYINQTVNVTVNETQFDSNNPISIKESWLTSFIESISKWANYWTKTENINATGYNITADYYFGDGSQLTGVSGGNSSFNQSLTDEIYVPYLNANSNVNLGDKNLSASYIQTNIINFSGGIVYYNGTDNIWDFS
jgi:hypothetical protein